MADRAAFKVALVSADPGEVPSAVSERLAGHGVSFVARRCGNAAELADTAGDADVVWFSGSPPVIRAENLPLLKRCRALLRTGSGVDSVPVAEADRRGILVVNTPGAIAETVADHAAALLFAASRRITAQDRAVRRGTWDPEYAWPRGYFSGRTLGVAGFGRIARALVRKLGGFEMKVLAWDPFVDPAEMARLRVTPADFGQLLEGSDFLSIHCPLTPETRGLFNAAAFRRVKPGVVLVNTARGAVIDEPALVEALRDGRVSAAGLDVLAEEPPAPDNPLLAMENVVVTPHLAAFSDRFREDFWEHSLRALIALAQSRLPESCVNPGAFGRGPRA